MSRARATKGRHPAPPAPPQARYDFGLALETASKPPSDRLRMLLDFLTAPLDEASAPKWTAVLKGLPIRPMTSSSGRLKIQWQMFGSYEPFDVATLKRFQSHLGRGIHSLTAPQPGDAWQRVWPLPRPEGLGMFRSKDGFVWQYVHKDHARGDDGSESAVILAAAQLVAEHGDRVRACKLEGCGKLFVATKRQEYCDARHSQQQRDRQKADKRKNGGVR